MSDFTTNQKPRKRYSIKLIFLDETISTQVMTTLPTQHFMDDNRISSRKSRKWPQYFAAAIAVISSTCGVTTLGWSSPALPYLENLLSTKTNNSTLHDNVSSENNHTKLLTNEESALVASLLILGSVFGSLPAGLLCEKFGRRLTIQISNALFLLGWILLCSVERNAVLILSARFIQGIGVTINCIPVLLYNEEIAEVEVRGTIGVFYDFSIALGVLWSYFFGSVVLYFWMNISCTALNVISIIGVLYIPESPVYLLKKSQRKKAEESLKWLRRYACVDDPNIAGELCVIQEIIDSAKMRSETGESYTDVVKNFSCKSFCSATAKSFYVITVLMMVRQLGGLNALTFYTVHIFEETGANISSYLSTTVSGVIQLVFVFVAFVAVDRLGRRILLLVSSMAVSISVCILAVYFFAKSLNYNTDSFSWLPVLCVCIYFAMFSIGLGPIPWFMMAEIIPTESKKWTTGACTVTNFIFTFITIHLFPLMEQKMGNGWTFMSFCIFNVIGFIFIMFIVPETKNKPIETIHDELSKMRFMCK